MRSIYELTGQTSLTGEIENDLNTPVFMRPCISIIYGFFGYSFVKVVSTACSKQKLVLSGKGFDEVCPEKMAHVFKISTIRY